MKKSRLLGIAYACLITFIASSAHAIVMPLESRLGGLAYFDPNLNITWTADANLAASNNYGLSFVNPDGTMQWGSQTNAWVNALNTNSYLGNNTWRLPKTLRVGGVGANWDTQLSFDGSTDVGYNLSAPGSAFPEIKVSEMAFMYYNILGNIGRYDVFGVENACSTNCLSNIYPFSNLQSARYWSGSKGPGNTAFRFHFDEGVQGTGQIGVLNHVWAVADGDVFVPLAPALWLFGSGLLGLVGIARRRS